MAIQILVLTDDPSQIQPVIDALADRRARTLVHPMDSSLLSAAREAAPAAILLDVTGGTDKAGALQELIARDDALGEVPLFALGGMLAGATSEYEDLGEHSSIAAEILAVAELTFGFQETDDEDLFGTLDEDMDVASAIGPPAKSTSGPPSPPPPAPPRMPPPPGAKKPARRTPPPAAPPSTSSSKATPGLAAKDREIEALRAQVEALEAAREQSAQEQRQAADRLEDVEAQRAELEQTNLEYQDANAEFESANTQLQSELDRLHQTLRETEAQLQNNAQVADLEERVDTLTAEYEELSQQRDDILAISSEFESALKAAETRAVAYEDALEKADGAITALHADLGVYAAAAHRAREQHLEQQQSAKELTAALEGALVAARAVIEHTMDVLPETRWETAYNAYDEAMRALVQEQGGDEDDEIEDAEVLEDDENGEEDIFEPELDE